MISAYSAVGAFVDTWVWLVAGAFLIAGVLVLQHHNRVGSAARARELQDRLDSFNAALDAARMALIGGNGHAQLPILDAGKLAYRPVRGETLVGAQGGVSRMELRSTGRYTHKATTLSVPIIKGVRYRTSMGRTLTEKALTATDEGRILLTDKAFQFEGRARNIRISWAQIADAEFLLDGLRISRRHGPELVFSIPTISPSFCAVFDVLLRRGD